MPPRNRPGGSRPPPPPGPCSSCERAPPEVKFTTTQLHKGERRRCTECCVQPAASSRPPPAVDNPSQPLAPGAAVPAIAVPAAAPPAAPAPASSAALAVVGPPDDAPAPPAPPAAPARRLAQVIRLSGDESEYLVCKICRLWDELDRAQRQPDNAVSLLSGVLKNALTDIEENLVQKLLTANSGGADISGRRNGMIEMWNKLVSLLKKNVLKVYVKEYTGVACPLHRDLFHVMGVRNALVGHAAGYMVDPLKGRWYVNLMKRLWERFCEPSAEQQARLAHIEVTDMPEAMEKMWEEADRQQRALREQLPRHWIYRRWLFNTIHDKLQDGAPRTAGHCLMSSPAGGYGLTAAVAAGILQREEAGAESIFQQHGCDVLAFHLCQTRVSHTHNPAVLVRSVAWQVAQAVPAYAARLQTEDSLRRHFMKMDEEGEWSCLRLGILEPLAQIRAELVANGPSSSQRLVLLVVDRVDNAADGILHLLQQAAQLVADTPSLASWLRILATSRQSDRVRGALAPLIPCTNIQDLAASDEPEGGLRNYLSVRVESSTVLNRNLLDAMARAADGAEDGAAAVAAKEAIFEQFLAQAGGVFQSAVSILRDIEAGQRDFGNLVDMPSGRVEQLIAKLAGTATPYSVYRPVLECLLAAYDPLPKSKLLKALRLDGASGHYCGPPGIVRQRLDDALADLERLRMVEAPHDGALALATGMGTYLPQMREVDAAYACSVNHGHGLLAAPTLWGLTLEAHRPAQKERMRRLLGVSAEALEGGATSAPPSSTQEAHDLLAAIDDALRHLLHAAADGDGFDSERLRELADLVAGPLSGDTAIGTGRDFTTDVTSPRWADPRLPRASRKQSTPKPISRRRRSSHSATPPPSPAARRRGKGWSVAPPLAAASWASSASSSSRVSRLRAAPIFWLVGRGCLAPLSVLLACEAVEFGAKHEVDGYTALTLAASVGRLDVVERLLASARPDLKADQTDRNGRTMLHLVVASSPRELAPERTRSLLARFPELSRLTMKQDAQGRTPLHSALKAWDKLEFARYAGELRTLASGRWEPRLSDEAPKLAVDMTDRQKGRTPLLLAVELLNVEAVQELLAGDAKLQRPCAMQLHRAVDSAGRSAFHVLAAKHANRAPRVAEVLLEAARAAGTAEELAALLRMEDAGGETALAAACRTGSKGVAGAILATGLVAGELCCAGAEASGGNHSPSRKPKPSPLAVGARAGHMQMLHLLKEHVQEDSPDGAGRTALLHAAAAEQLDTLGELLRWWEERQKEAGEPAQSPLIDPAAKCHADMTALMHLAAAGGSSDPAKGQGSPRSGAKTSPGRAAKRKVPKLAGLIRRLHRAGCLLADEDRLGRNAVFLAAEAGNTDFLRALLDASTQRVEAADGDGSAAEDGNAGSRVASLSRAELEAAASASDASGATPLLAATARGHAGAVSALLNALPQLPEAVNVAGGQGVTPLVMAIRKGHREVFQALLHDARVDVNLGKPLHEAVQQNNLSFVKSFLYMGQHIDEARPLTAIVQLNQKDDSGRSAFALAVHLEQPEVAGALLPHFGQDHSAMRGKLEKLRQRTPEQQQILELLQA